jgi:hypothetical protein
VGMKENLLFFIGLKLSSKKKMYLVGFFIIIKQFEMVVMVEWDVDFID